jgi:hypothetical protein
VLAKGPQGMSNVVEKGRHGEFDGSNGVFVAERLWSGVRQ